MTGFANAVPAPTSSSSPVLALDHLTVEYELGGARIHRAVDDVSFVINDGEILGVVGQSGSGKTSVGKVVAGFVRPTHGTLRIRDGGGGLRERAVLVGRGFRDVQMIFQESAMALDPRMPAWKSVAEAFPHDEQDRPRRARWGEVRDRALQELRHVGLGQ
ncbi:MAG: ATP-binding cassette domain-containing protein, partial [Thaumarchaeota archaeon]|nr:ATP-binding cassette domain-containing protein [Nitrososphaerota archaeon]